MILQSRSRNTAHSGIMLHRVKHNFRIIGSVIFLANGEPGMYSYTSRLLCQLCSAYTSVQLYCQGIRGYALPKKYLRNSCTGAF